MTQKLNTDNGLQRQPTENQPVTSVMVNGRLGALYDCFVINNNLVLRINPDISGC